MAALYGGGLQCAYTREREIGTGHFGRVYAARDASGRLCAMKVVPQESVRTQQAIHYLRDEAENLRKASHPNICKFIECGKVNREYCIVMELCAGGSMRQLLDKYNTGFPEVHVCKWTRQIASALQWLHSLKIMHRDLNPNNILFSTIDWRVADIKICDFGISKFCPQGITASALGTPIYCAPELRKQMAYNDKCDLYSLGATLHEMLQGPFDSEQVGRVASFKLPPLSVPCSAAAKDLVDKLLKPESERLDWRQLLEHPYISGACVAVALLRAGAPPTATSCICFTATDLQPLTQDCSMEIIPREFTHQNLQQSLRRVSEFEAVAHAATEEYVHRIVWCAFLPKPAVLQSIITAEPAYSGHQAALHQNSESLQLEAENVLEDVEKILELCHNTYVLLGVLELHAISLRKKLKDKLAERTREWNQRQLRFDVFRACKLSAVSDHARRLVVVADLPATFPPSEAQKGLLSLSERELPSYLLFFFFAFTAPTENCTGKIEIRPHTVSRPTSAPHTRNNNSRHQLQQSGKKTAKTKLSQRYEPPPGTRRRGTFPNLTICCLRRSVFSCRSMRCVRHTLCVRRRERTCRASWSSSRGCRPILRNWKRHIWRWSKSSVIRCRSTARSPRLRNCTHCRNNTSIPYRSHSPRRQRSLPTAVGSCSLTCLWSNVRLWNIATLCHGQVHQT
eukprot:TRINITY_DN1832_c0_g1_i1.p1 TRINITY_DN1832_c0_g1~~TRINITY_DN1832_c0_g1_i1.p1  ORF type:complete len:716 (-),score=83.07 TRINITY_DN1832_c0_g1_i1:1581-3626(-)